MSRRLSRLKQAPNRKESAGGRPPGGEAASLCTNGAPPNLSRWRPTRPRGGPRRPTPPQRARSSLPDGACPLPPKSSDLPREAAEPPATGLLDERISRYEIHRIIGRGRMEMVSQAIDPQLKRKMAVMVARDTAAYSEQKRLRFIAEAQTTSQLGELPNIVPVHDLGFRRGRTPLLCGEEGRRALDGCAPRRPGLRGARGPGALDPAPAPDHLRADRPCDGLRPRPGCAPPRSEARQHHGLR
jgi:hypothetical protein